MKYFSDIIILPLHKNINVRKTPENVLLNNCLVNCSVPGRKKKAFFNLFLRLKILFSEFKHTNKRAFFLSNIRLFSDIIALNIFKAKILEKEIKKIKSENLIFYSYWMNDGALLFSILKVKKKINDFIFRVHGYDLFDERRKSNYMPFRYTNMKYCKNVYTVSENARIYLKSKKIFPEKIKLSKLGTFDYGINPFLKTEEFLIISCSNIISLKRIDLISEILKNIQIKVKWIHIGAGKSKTAIVKQAEKLPKNIKYEFTGQLSNEDIMRIYKKTKINLFINTSESEGLPVSIMEAISFGIPVIATDVGGVSEIVNEKTGILIPKDFNIDKVADIIDTFVNSKYNTIEFRKGVRKFWKENFDAGKNYTMFYQQITS